MKTLRLPLKKKWFKLTKSGVKTEDYREITHHWISRLTTNWDKHIFPNELIFKDFDKTILTLGYPSKEETDKFLTYEHKGIEIRTGNPAWGAEPDKLYFVIKHGKLLTP
jgi:hypothetical protein